MRIKHQVLSIGLAAASLLTAAGRTHAGAQQTVGVVPSGPVDAANEGLEARVWLDRGDEPVLERGDDVRVYYRTTDDAWVSIFRIDTDGRVSLLFPQDPGVDNWVQEGRDYRLLLEGTPRWRVRDDPGLGYFFMIASPAPMDFSRFGFDERRGWDLSDVGESVYEDPYVAIDEYVAAILPDWESVPYGLDFLSYSVGEDGEDHDYPRFLCYDCHEPRSYATWNPYADLCDSYQVVMWNDPYFVPRYRYVGTRVVFARPFGARPRYGVSVRRPGSTRGVVVLERSAPLPRSGSAVYKESARAARPSAPVRSQPSPAVQGRPAVGSRAGPSIRTPTPAPAASRPQASRPQASRPQASRPQASRPQASRPQASRPQASRPQVDRPRAAPTRATPARVVPPRSAPARTSRPTARPQAASVTTRGTAPAARAAPAPGSGSGRAGSTGARPAGRRRGG